MRIISLIIILSVAFVWQGCSQAESFDQMIEDLLSHSVPVILPSDFPEDAVFLDAREKAEFDVSHIEGAQHIGYDNFDMTSITEIDKTSPIVVYCSVGYRSEKIAEQLVEAGYSNVYNLYGGIFHWVNSGGTVVNENGTTQQVHAYNRKWGKWLEKGEKVY